MLDDTYTPEKPKLGYIMTHEKFQILFQKIARPLLHDIIGENERLATFLQSCFMAIASSEGSKQFRTGQRENDHLWPQTDAHEFSISKWVYGNGGSPVNYKGRFGNNTLTGYRGDAFLFRGVGFAQITFKANYKQCITRLRRLSDVLPVQIVMPYKVALQYAQAISSADTWDEEKIRAIWANPAFDIAMMAAYMVEHLEAKSNVKISGKYGSIKEWTKSLSTRQNFTTSGSSNDASLLFQAWGYPTKPVLISRTTVPSNATLAKTVKMTKAIKPIGNSANSKKVNKWDALKAKSINNLKTRTK